MGVGSMSWTPRIPEITEALALSATGLGVVLFLYSTGALVGAHLSGRIIHRLGTRRAATLAVSGQLASTVRPRPTPAPAQVPTGSTPVRPR
jgi:predicted MFS family arabinose efflux permease